MWDPKKLTFYLGCYIQGAKTKERKRRAKTLPLDVLKNVRNQRFLCAFRRERERERERETA